MPKKDRQFITHWLYEVLNDPKFYPIWHLANLHVNDDLAMESTVPSSVTTSVVKVEPPKIETAAFFGQCVFVISGQ